MHFACDGSGRGAGGGGGRTQTTPSQSSKTLLVKKEVLRMLNDRNFGVITRVRVKTPVERLQPSLHVVLGQQLQPATRRARERKSAFDAGAQTCLALRLPASELLPLQLSLLTLARSTHLLQLQRCTQRLHAQPQPHHHRHRPPAICARKGFRKDFPESAKSLDIVFTALFRFKICNNSRRGGGWTGWCM